MSFTVKVDPSLLKFPTVKSTSAPSYAEQQQQQQLLGDPHPSVQMQNGKLKVNREKLWTNGIWAPVGAREQIKWPALSRSIFLELVHSFAYAYIVPTVVSISASGTGGLNAFLVAVTSAMFILFSYSWRIAENTPRHIFPGLTIAYFCHNKFGVIYSLLYLAAQYGGSALANFPLGAAGNAAVPNPAGAIRPTTYWGYFGVEFGFGVLVLYAILQNQSLIDHLKGKRSAKKAEKSTMHRGNPGLPLIAALATFVGIMGGWSNGAWTLCNAVVYFGAGISLGFTSNLWTVPLLWGLAAGVVAWALHIVTWNVNGYTWEEQMQIVQQEGASLLDDSQSSESKDL